MFFYDDFSKENEIVLGKDDRKAVHEVNQLPFRWICSLEVEFPEPVLYPLATLEYPEKAWETLTPTKKGCGTGLLISPNHILSAAHVLSGIKMVSSPKDNRKRFKLVKASKVRAIPSRTKGVMQEKASSKAFQAKQIFVSKKFQKGFQQVVPKLTRLEVKKNLSFDYGVIELQNQMDIITGKIKIPGQQFGWWGEQNNYLLKPISDPFRNSLPGVKMKVAGYPGDKSNNSCSALWTSSGRLRNVFPKLAHQVQDLLLYDADTSAGMSGSPVWIKHKNGKHYLIGVHSSYFKQKTKKNPKPLLRNVAAMVSSNMIAELRSWKVNYLEFLI